MFTTAERSAIERGCADPAWWVETVLGLRPWSAQALALASVRDNPATAIRSCHAAGKSTIAAAAVLWFVANHPRSLVITTATSHRQVRGILWREVRRLHRDARYPIGGVVTETQLRFAEDWWAWGFTAREYDATRFQGFHAPHVLVVVDEAAGVAPAVFEGLEGALSAGHTRLLMVGNPTTAAGDFGRAFTEGHAERIVIDAFDTPNFTEHGVTIEDVRSGEWERKVPAHDADLPYPNLIHPRWVRDRWERWCGGREAGETDARWVSRVRANFPAEEADALVPLMWVEAAVERWRDLVERDGWPTAASLGVDVARFGDDSTIVADARHGAGVRSLERAPKQDTMATAGTAMATAAALRSSGVTVRQILVDADGLGAGVYDRLVELHGGPRRAAKVVREVRGGVRAVEHDRFENRRSEMHWMVREMLDPRGEAPIALPPDDDLAQELTSMRWRTTSRGRIAIEGKDDIRARIGRSPDAADAVAYALSEVPPSSRGAVEHGLLEVGRGSLMADATSGARLIDPTCD